MDLVELELRNGDNLLLEIVINCSDWIILHFGDKINGTKCVK